MVEEAEGGLLEGALQTTSLRHRRRPEGPGQGERALQLGRRQADAGAWGDRRPGKGARRHPSSSTRSPVLAETRGSAPGREGPSARAARERADPPRDRPPLRPHPAGLPRRSPAPASSSAASPPAHGSRSETEDALQIEAPRTVEVERQAGEAEPARHSGRPRSLAGEPSIGLLLGGGGEGGCRWSDIDGWGRRLSDGRGGHSLIGEAVHMRMHLRQSHVLARTGETPPAQESR